MTTNEMKKLVGRAMNRDNEAMERLYKECYEDVYFVCKKYSLNDDDAKDITQDTFVHAFNKLSTLDNGEKFRAWITRIAANKCLDMLKHNNVLTIDSMYDENDEIIDIPDINKPTEDIVVEKEVREILAGMMEKLPVEQRVTLFMYYYQNYSIREIASAYGCSESTVKSRLNYAKKTMRAEAEKLENKGIKLRVVAVLPFLYVFFQSERSVFACEIPDSTALLSQVMGNYTQSEVTASNVSANMNISGGVSKAGMAKGLLIKIIAGVIGTAAVVGGVIVAISLSSNNKTESISPTSAGIVNESTTGDNLAENTDSDNEDESTTQGNTEPDERLVEYFERYKEFIENEPGCWTTGGLSLYCDNKAKNSVEQIIRRKSDNYNLFSMGTLTMSNNGYDIGDNHYSKFITYGEDGQLYLYERKERDYIDGKGRPISAVNYNKFTRTPAEKFNFGQLWLEFINEAISNPTIRNIEVSQYVSFEVILTGERLQNLLYYTSIAEHVNDYLQYCTDKRFEDYTYEVTIEMKLNDVVHNEIRIKSDELVKDLIEGYVIRTGNGNSDNYVLTNDPNYQTLQQIRLTFFFTEHESHWYCYPYYMDVEAAGNNVLVDIYDTHTEPHYILLPKDIPGYEHYTSMEKKIMFKDTSDENITKRIIVHDRIGSSGKYGMEMDDDAFRYVNFDRAKGDLVVNKTTMGGYDVYYTIHEGNLEETRGKDENGIFIYAQVELLGLDAGVDAGYICVVIEYVGKDNVPATDGMMETLAHIAENLEYVEVEEHIVKIKTE